MSDLVLGITGASGSIYAVRLLEVLLNAGRHVHVVLSAAGRQVFDHELGRAITEGQPVVEQLITDPSPDCDLSRGRVSFHDNCDFTAGIASGSFRTGGMVICPCSMGTLSAVAHGLSTNLIQRAADVHLKERRQLIVVPRETPLGSVQLENMKRLCDAGAVILPAMPGFYHHPKSISDLVDFVVARVCDQLNVEQSICGRWGEDSTGEDRLETGVRT